jgi:hypothetical protein
MRNCLLAIIILSLTSALGWAQEASPPPVSSHPPTDARYTIIQSPLAGKWQFRLDRFAGYVYQIVKTSSGGTSWERMPVVGLPSRRSGNKPHYQIFTSGLAARHTFLLNTDSGKSWVLTSQTSSDGSKQNVWAPFEN